MWKQGLGRLALFIVVAASLSGCVTLPPNHKPPRQDPWESWNRGVYKFNDALDRHILKPVARGYVRALPHPVRTGISNFFSNLKTPTVMINDALQGKFLAAANDLGRFVLNTTVGVGGLLDPATSAGLSRNQADFGLTLGHWGLHAGPFVELPILGPSSVRDATGKVADIYTDPRHYIKDPYVSYGLYLLDAIDQRAALLPLDETLKGVYDPYAFIRDAYLAHRAYLATGKSPDEEPLVDPEAERPDTAKPGNPSEPLNPSAPSPSTPTAPSSPPTAPSTPPTAPSTPPSGTDGAAAAAPTEPSGMASGTSGDASSGEAPSTAAPPQSTAPDPAPQ